MKRIDEKEVELILHGVGKEDELIFPEGLELDDMQKQFIRGYMHAQQDENGGFAEDDEKIRRQILQVRSKYCEPILEFLFQEGELYHGDLADKMNMSPSGLNAIIKKMMECNPPIIIMTQVGKFTIYSLTDEMKRYMENKSQSKGNRNRGSKVFHENVMLTLQHFVEKAGEDWKDILNLLLQGERTDIGEDIEQSFFELAEQAKQAEECDAENYEMVKKAMKNDILSYLLDEYVAELKECEEIMEEIGQRKNGKRLMRHFRMQ